MDYENILMLTKVVRENLVTTGDDLIGRLLAKKCHFLSYVDVYQEYGYKGVQNYILDYAKANNIKCLFNMASSDDFYFDLNFYEKLRKDMGIVRFIGDTEHYYDGSEQYYCQTADLVVAGDQAAVYRLRLLGVNSCLCWGPFDTGKYSNKKLPKDIDLSFVGQVQYKVNRAYYLKYLADNGINIKVYGPGTRNGAISFEEKLNVHNRSKIVLSISGVSEITRLSANSKVYRRFKQIKAPVFEGIMCGSFVLAEAAPGLDELFEPGRELDVFSDEREMLDKVKYYLAHSEEREEIALRGFKKLKEKKYCDVDHYLPEIMAKLHEALRKKETRIRPPVYVDDVFLKNFSSFRVLMFIVFLKKLKFRHALTELIQFLKHGRLDLYQLRVFIIQEVLDLYPGLKNFLKKLIGDTEDATPSV